MNNVYPSIDELMPSPLLSMIPANLAKEIAMRYTTLGEKYLTDNIHTDGRRINAMMYTDRIENCIEEIVDAVFCILGWIFRSNIEEGRISDSAYTALRGLIDIYTLLSTEWVKKALK